LDRLAVAAERNRRHYDSLPSGNAVRSVEIQPGKNDERIVCFLNTIPQLHDAAAYRALSYCWGDATDAAEILCNGTPFFITRSLLAALQRLRSGDSTILLWVDAICINQHDITERNHQVSIMRQIYSQATQADIWLGEADATTAEAVELIEKMAMQWCSTTYGPPESGDRFWWARNLHDEDDPGGLLRAFNKPGPTDSSDLGWRAIVRYYQHPWFTRVWVIQEIQSSRRAWVHCDGTRTEWEFVALVARWALEQQLIGALDRHLSLRGLRQAPVIQEQLWSN